MIDREAYAVLCKNHQNAFLKGTGKIVSSATDLFDMTELYTDLCDNLRSSKCFVFAKTAAQRVENMNPKGVIENPDAMASIIGNDERGFLVSPLYSINAEYSISNGGLRMVVYKGRATAGYCLFVPAINKNNGVFFVPWSPIISTLSKIKNGLPLLPLKNPYRSDFENRCLRIESAIEIHQIEKILNNLSHNNFQPLQKYPEWLSEEFREYTQKRNACIFALSMYIFLKTAQVYDEEYVSDIPKAYSRSKGVRKLDYCIIDSTWDKNINVINPFAVRGHFRHQPKKDNNGKWYRELIYIDSFMKKGYHRKATKNLQEE